MKITDDCLAKAESILGLMLLKLGFTTDHLTNGQLDGARDIIASALAAPATAQLSEEQLYEKEITIANHIRHAAVDGCQCEPCNAARDWNRGVHTDACKSDLATHGCVCGAAEYRLWLRSQPVKS